MRAQNQATPIINMRHLHFCSLEQYGNLNLYKTNFKLTHPGKVGSFYMDGSQQICYSQYSIFSRALAYTKPHVRGDRKLDEKTLPFS